jgi:hypothetical protein
MLGSKMENLFGERRRHDVLDCMVSRRNVDDLERTNSLFQYPFLRLDGDRRMLRIEAEGRPGHAIDVRRGVHGRRDARHPERQNRPSTGDQKKEA